MTLSVVFVVIICSQLWFDVGQSCPHGFYFDLAVDNCEPCINICDPRRGTESKCRLYADECTEYNNFLVTLSSTFALEEESSEVKRKAAVTSADAELWSTGLIVGLFLSSLCLLGFMIITVVVTRQCKPQCLLGGIFRRQKSKTVHVVHPVEEGIGQIHPSSHTPPRMLFEMTRHALPLSSSSSSSSSSHLTAAVRLFSAFRETGKPQQDEEDNLTSGANPGSSSSTGSYLIYTTLSTD